MFSKRGDLFYVDFPTRITVDSGQSRATLRKHVAAQFPVIVSSLKLCQVSTSILTFFAEISDKAFFALAAEVFESLGAASAMVAADLGCQSPCSARANVGESGLACVNH